MKYDFAGWATRYNMKCSDGRTIKNDAFKHHDETTVPLVWNHVYDTPDNVIGHATLKHCEEGVYAYCEFNENDAAVSAKNLVVHGDITSLSMLKISRVASKLIMSSTLSTLVLSLTSLLQQVSIASGLLVTLNSFNIDLATFGRYVGPNSSTNSL